jgi:hypothetical protein
MKRTIFNLTRRFIFLLVLILMYIDTVQPLHAGNPVFPGWYADPEGIVFDNQYWIYPTYSSTYEQQVFMDAFSSPDLVHWSKHNHVIDTAQIKWAKKAMWAPAIIKKDNKYFMFFGANDIQNNTTVGGIGIGVSDKPEGPFHDYLGKPLLDKFYNGAQPIDQFVFQDIDNQYYLIYGGWSHCNIAKMQSDFKAFTPFNDGITFKEITPSGYVEGPFMFRRNNKYYFMWSEGGWTGPDYRVAYAIGDSPFGPFTRIGLILQQNAGIATGAGHHSVINVPGTDEWYIVYHRRPLGETDGNSRVTCVDKMIFNLDGTIKPVVMTFDGVSPRFIDGPVTVFKNCSYSGDSIKLGRGKYTQSDLLKMGFANNDLSSLTVKNGLEVVLFDGDNFTGNSVRISENVKCLDAQSFDNITSSMIIRRSGDANLAGTYYIQNNASGLFLGTIGNSRKEGAKLEINSGSFLQQFELQSLHDGLYILKAVNASKVLQIERAGSDTGSLLEQASVDTTLLSQQFVLQSVGNGNFKIFNNNSDLLLEAAGIETGSIVRQSDDSGQVKSLWKLLKQSDVAFIAEEDCSGRIAGGAYYDDCEICVGGTTGKLPCKEVVVKAYGGCNYSSLGIGLKAGEYRQNDFAGRLFDIKTLSSINLNAGYVAELYDKDNFSGNSITIETGDSCLTENNFDNVTQSMIVRRKGETNLEGTFCLQNKQSGLFMRVQSDSETNGANIIQSAYLGKTSQQFQLNYVGGGYYNIMGLSGAKTLTIAKPSTNSGAYLQQWDNTNADITNIGGIISSQYNDTPAAEGVVKLIDNQSATKFLTGHSRAWVQYKVPGTTALTSYSITSANDSPERDPLNWILQASNDEVNWKTIDTKTGIDFPSRFQTMKFNCENTTAYGFYRLDMTNNSGTNLQLAEIELFGTVGGAGGYDNQKFVIQAAGDGYYKIFNKYSNMLVDILGNSAGYNVIQKADAGQQSGLWKLILPESLPNDVDLTYQESKLSISPNPVTDVINITGLKIHSTCNIYNCMGTKIKSLNGVSTDVSELQPGIYVLKCNSGLTVSNLIFIKK